ncbi:MAG TPA: phage holin family protein [Prolixibacteraceae bacterium]|jgi:ABC-type polysaccharide/polyol phosphate export permease
MPDNGKIDELTDSLKSYVNTNFELIKYQAIERSTVIIADLISNILVGLLLLFFVFFISLWACYYISAQLGDSYSGIAIVAGFYLLVGLILLMVRKKLLIKPLRNKIVHNIFQKDHK